MKRSFVGLIVSLLMVCILAIPCSAAEIKDESEEKYTTIKEYKLANTHADYMKLAKEASSISASKASAKLNGKDIPCYIVEEKVKDVRKADGELGTIYRVTVIASEPTDLTSGVDESATSTTRCWVRCYYYGSESRSGVTFKRVSSWEGKVERLAPDVTYLTRATYALAYGETYDYGTVGSSAWNPARTEKAISSNNTWYSLTPSWSTKYIAHTGIMGQMAGTYAQMNRGGSTWDLDVKLTTYGLSGGSFL
jgi:hypothetical protein